MALKVAVIGATGQLGHDLLRNFSDFNFETYALGHADIEVRSLESVSSALGAIRPDFVVNTAAFHNVSLCESEPDMAHEVNVVGAVNVAKTAREIGAKNVYISTDYVFSGAIPAGSFNYIDSQTNAQTVYGKTKSEAEVLTLEISPENLVFRISSVFGKAGSSGKGGNFIEAILKKISTGEVAQVVSDTRMTPTYTLTAADILRNLLEDGVSGIQHGSSEGQCSWFELARQAATLIGLENLVDPIDSPNDAFPIRPVNSSLDTSSLRVLGIENEHWTDSVYKYMREKGHVK